MSRNDSVGVLPANLAGVAIEQFVRDVRADPAGQRTFFDAADFPWVKSVETRYGELRKEIDRLLSASALLPSLEEVQTGQTWLSDDRRWKVFPLFAYGVWIEENVRRCPRLAEAIRHVEGLTVAMLSILGPHKELPSHHGNYCGLLRYHMGMKIPQPVEECGIKVGNDIRHWGEGESLIFDDTYLHSAWNHTAEYRTILLVDFVRPLPPALRDINSRIIESIGRSASVSEATRRWHAWEASHGHMVDERLAAAASEASLK